MVDLEKCTKGLKDILCGGLLLLDCWLEIEVHAWTRAQHQPLEHIELPFKYTHTRIKTPVFIELWSYSTDSCCYIRGRPENRIGSHYHLTAWVSCVILPLFVCVSLSRRCLCSLVLALKMNLVLLHYSVWLNHPWSPFLNHFEINSQIEFTDDWLFPKLWGKGSYLTDCQEFSLSNANILFKNKKLVQSLKVEKLTIRDSLLSNITYQFYTLPAAILIMNTWKQAGYKPWTGVTILTFMQD